MKKTALEKWICEVEGFSALTRPKLEDLQLERLNALLGRERRRGGFYGSLPERLSCLGELSSLPFTSAEELSRRGGEMLLCSQSNVQRVVSGVTSGTTGPSKRLFYSVGDIEHTIGFFAAGISEFTEAHDRVMIAMPFSGEYGLGDLIAKAVERLGAVPLRTGMGLSYDELSQTLSREKPSVYIGMPVPLLSLLRYCGQGSLRQALVSGDACPPELLRSIEALLGARLFPHYGSRECGLGGAVSCAAHEGMHIRENHIIAEIIDDGGHPVENGTWGELVISTIGQQAQPLLRYRTGDRARILPEPCPCGGITKRLDTVMRANPFEAAISKLDDSLFSFPWLVDYSARYNDGGIELNALSLDGEDAQALCAAASEALPGFRFTARLRRVSGEDRSTYFGKRILLS